MFCDSDGRLLGVNGRLCSLIVEALSGYHFSVTGRICSAIAVALSKHLLGVTGRYGL